MWDLQGVKIVTKYALTLRGFEIFQFFPTFWASWFLDFCACEVVSTTYPEELGAKFCQKWSNCYSFRDNFCFYIMVVTYSARPWWPITAETPLPSPRCHNLHGEINATAVWKGPKQISPYGLIVLWWMLLVIICVKIDKSGDCYTANLYLGPS